ncbi:N-acetylmuramic acid 6-phosphate etherase [Pelosinus fermentans]|uniref:N-acetylmuramic acid 6-phosphate etherase n=1 Tax=Pelosinus fermentans JBW45 TaxID=1192197 RepID=I8TU90_9FIRM|nr:N-acetylmuramic acid 6-phosphate etherase [Pelosinus fermentans]AJQ28756.1 N-acetylmuramic acid 6-phosphate etherase [Pelosinus fermentans JBW45]
MTVDIESLMTEQRNPKTENIDQLSTAEMLKLINDEDKIVAYAVEKEIPNIAQAVDKVVEALPRGGRLVYIGAGTSGRLGVLDASECPPTFGVDDSMVVGLIAGGDHALRNAIEGAEDDEEEAVRQLRNIGLSVSDVLIGIAASGRTPYVVGGLKYANELGATTMAISCSPNSVIGDIAKIAITLVVGPEVIAGSTRLKAGTAQKLVLNMITTAAMIQIGKVYGNLMVDVKASNVKLLERAKRIVAQATGLSIEQAKEFLEQANYNPKLAIVMSKQACTMEEAKMRLEKAHGVIRKALSVE